MQIDWLQIFNIFFHQSPMLWFLSPILIIAYSWCDRFWGADGTKRLAKGLVVLTSVVSWIIAGPALAISTYFWALYRSISFSGGASAPIDAEQRSNAQKRHLYAIPLILLTCLGMIYNVSNIPLIVAGLIISAVIGYVYAYNATELAYSYGKVLLEVLADPNKTLGKFNEKLERKRGLYYGIAIMLVVLISSLASFLWN